MHRSVFFVSSLVFLSGCGCGDPKITPVFDAGCTQELCNGLDDDCDGVVDNGFAEVTCGVGACARTVGSCVDGVELTCEPGSPAAEVCNGIDDDCDGEVDEGFGELRCGTGACERVVSACAEGVPGICEAPAPAEELCNGLDDDCDGAIDNGFGEASCGVGACARTVESCVDGEAFACEPGQPGVEICDGLDNDCDGEIDENGICNPPVVLCSGALTGMVDMPQTLSATAFDTDGEIVATWWMVVLKPDGSTAVPTPIDQPTTTFTPDLPGNYTLAFCARDNGGTTTCCSSTVSTSACATPPSPPASTACGTSWDGRPIVQFPAVPSGHVYQLTVAGDPLVRAQAAAGANHLRPSARLGAGGPPPGTPIALELRACVSGEANCCSAPTQFSVDLVEACATPIAPSSSTLVISEYVVNGEAGQAGEAIELTNLSNCPLSLDGYHFGYRNAGASSGSFRWMNFGPADVIPPRGVYVTMRDQGAAPTCAQSLSATPQSTGLFGLRISSLAMEGPNLQSGWFNNTGGGQSILQVARGHVANAGALTFGAPVAQVAPYQSSSVACAGTGFNAVNSCGDFPGNVTPTTLLSPNQLGRLWHPCDAVSNAVPHCARD